MTFDRLQGIRRFYTDYAVQHKLIRYLYNRELCLISPKGWGSFVVRNLRVHNTQSFQFYLNFLRMFRDPMHSYNLYYSMAKFDKGIPFRNTKSGNLKEDFTQWNRDCKRLISSYDMLIDIDAGTFGDIGLALESAMLVRKRLLSDGIAFYQRFSGMGFHLVAPYRQFGAGCLDPDGETNIYQAMKERAQNLHDTCSEMIDVNIYDCRRVAKLPYTVAIYGRQDMVCAPVNDLDSFDVGDYRLGTFKKMEDDLLHNG